MPTPTPADLFDLTGRTAVVTGASSGLGERFARLLHGAGATVVVAARRSDRLGSLAADLGDRCVPVTCDVTVAADREALVAAAADTGRLDLLVNNAGISDPMPAEDEPVDHFARVVDVNLNALFALTQAAYPALAADGGGAVVNVASILGLVASAPIKQASYTATKGAVVNLTRELACQWARRGVRVNALAPGWFPSELTAEMFADESSMTYVARNCPAGRAGVDGELDSALLFLCSPASSYVTGITLAVDGGWTAR